MNYNLFILFVFLLIIFILLASYTRSNSTEQFTQEQHSFSNNLALFLVSKPSFIQYLDKLVQLGNTSNKLISKDIYNKFISMDNIQKNDILTQL